MKVSCRGLECISAAVEVCCGCLVFEGEGYA